ncbi:MAG TPA: tripartite tricarboxylate transporter substrate binding protein [Burkholderiales bacterium]|nr:tripartite tricarboxylate transporter substrate binding protein [Burkholderiales bacterium]
MKRLVLLALACAFAGSALAQQYPAKPIRIIVPTAAGGTGDSLARFVADRLTEAFKQQVVVENRPGANGIIATDYVVKSAPDGYTLVAASAGNIAINPGLYGSKLPFNPERDLAPVALIANTTQIMIAHPSLPARNVKELIALARSKPGAIDYVNAGNGSTPHLNMVLFASMAGIKLQGIVYKGSTPGRIAVVAGETPLMIDGLIPSLPLVQSARVRALGVTSAKRVAILPDLPAIGETVPGYVGEIWYGILAPAGTPQDIIQRLNAAITKGLSTPEVKARFAKQGADVASGTPVEFGAFIRKEIVKWTQVVKASGATVD